MENVSYKCIRKKEDSIKQCEIMYLQYEHNKPMIKTFVAGHSFSLSLRVQEGMTCTARRLWRQCEQNWRMRGYRRLWLNQQGPVVQNPINDNPRLKVNQGIYFSTPRCCSTLTFGKNLHQKKSILKSKNKQKKLSPKSWKYERNFDTNPGLS